MVTIYCSKCEAPLNNGQTACHNCGWGAARIRCECGGDLLRKYYLYCPWCGRKAEYKVFQTQDCPVCRENHHRPGGKHCAKTGKSIEDYFLRQRFEKEWARKIRLAQVKALLVALFCLIVNTFLMIEIWLFLSDIESMFGGNMTVNILFGFLFFFGMIGACLGLSALWVSPAPLRYAKEKLYQKFKSREK